ncbi:type I-E CRISPR-associated protein Cas7/Cse4/CasC [Streptomyces sp. WAC01526]|uniref:type I-E CRISPR-associated protein Cas7/Cse4/CasC n=1 Tax=Streptomyces sp. WAC01526 TaxID=2588709 RepID=UPI0011E06693|nr:type I-E CRISPR-associated protein Cas7/Cse4/CasC [Streptomyces sp. WAC01526]
MAFLDIHILQNVPPSNINRDQDGSPKTATFGGVRRARVSSQAWKRATRTAFEADGALAGEDAVRTRQLPQMIADQLAERVPALAQKADAIGMAAAFAMFKVAAKKPKKKSEGDEPAEERPVTEYLLFLGRTQINNVVDTLAANTDTLAGASTDKELASVVGALGLKDLGVTAHPGAVALFGRMVANSPDTGVDAGCQVAHAISTHEAITEFDYFTAVDDKQQDDNKGAGMIGSLEFNSATLYRYATLDLRTLHTNLDGQNESTLKSALGFIRAFATSMPTGKANTFAHHTRPEVIVLSLREDRPVSHVDAFERPIARTSDGYLATSATTLFAHMADVDEQWGDTPSWSAAIYPSALETNGETKLPERVTWKAALAQAEDALTAALPKAQAK